MAYTLSGIKTFIGREGHGFNATLKRDGKAVAFARDDASGGSMWIDWKDGHRDSKEAYAFEVFARMEYDANGGRERHVKSLQDFGIEDETITEQSDADVAEDWINRAIDLHATEKRLKRLAKTQTLFRLKGDSESVWRTIPKHAYSQAIVDHLTKKHGDLLETIFNPAEVKL